MKRKSFALIILSICLIFIMTSLISCGDTGVKITYDACGGTFSNGDKVLTIEKQPGELLVEPISPSKKGAIFVGWSTAEDGSDFWDFNTDCLETNTTLYAVWRSAEAKLISFEGGEMTGSVVTLAASRDTSAINLSDIVTVSDYAGWVLSSDSEGADVIENKTITNLSLGENTYYIIVTAKDGVLTEVYTLKVVKDNTVIVTLDAVGGAIAETVRTITFGEDFTLPVPIRAGHVFCGWLYGSTLVTDDAGVSLFASNIAEEVTLTAAWRPEVYTVTLASADTSMGSVSGAGSYDYGRTVTVTATANQGYSFVGWYDGEGVLVSGNASYNIVVSGAVNLVARFELVPSGGNEQNPGGNVDDNGWTNG